MHICISKMVSDNGLSPGWCQANISTNAGILLIGPSGTNFSEILIEIQAFSFKQMHLEKVVCKMESISPQPQCVNPLSASPMYIQYLGHHCACRWPGT